MKIDIVVMRHKNLLRFIKKHYPELIGDDVHVVEHVEHVEQIENKNVLGVLPLSLATKAASITQVVPDVPRDKRGDKFKVKDLEEYCRGLETYEVKTTRSLSYPKS